jgi:hypothetical protein
MAEPEHITPADGNVFEDIGFPPGEARNLLIRSSGFKRVLLDGHDFVTRRARRVEEHEGELER